MSSESPDFASRYASLPEAELLQIAGSYDSLLEPAQQALRAEFARRHLEPPIVDEPAESLRPFVTIRSYRDLSEAIVARSLLESAGIPAFLRDENLARLEWQVSNFIGGIRLQVDPDDAENATLLLDQPILNSIPFSEQAEFPQPHCPRCGSTDIDYEGASRGAALASLYLFSLPLPHGHKTWHCNACDARWENTED